MSTRYLILRANSVPGDSFEPTAPASWASSAPGPSNLNVHIVDGYQKSLSELRDDPLNVAVADAEIALSPVEPKMQMAAHESAFVSVGESCMPEGLIAVGAHQTELRGHGVIAAILDTGIDDTHPAFHKTRFAKRNFTHEGWDEGDVRDFHGHGTHCAGTLCGDSVDGVRVGIAPGIAKLCVGKVLAECSGTLEGLIKGLAWAVIDQKASIVCTALQYDLPGNVARLADKGLKPAVAGQLVLRQYRDLTRAVAILHAFLQSRMPSLVVVAAGGNESARPDFIIDACVPATELLAVGALESAGDKWKIARFSNGLVGLAAPGVHVVSAKPGGGFACMAGTSMAAAHVAGVAALWAEKLAQSRCLDGFDMVRAALKAHATSHPLLPKDRSTVGAGMVQVPPDRLVVLPDSTPAPGSGRIR